MSTAPGTDTPTDQEPQQSEKEPLTMTTADALITSVLEDLESLALDPRNHLPTTDAGDVARETGHAAGQEGYLPDREEFRVYKAEIGDAMHAAASAVAELHTAPDLDHDELDFESRDAIDRQDHADFLAILNEAAR